MSVVAVRDGIIAADTCVTGGGVRFGIRKLMRRGDTAIGWAGHWADGRTFAEWYFDGASMTNLPVFHNRDGDNPPIDFCAIVLRPTGWEYWTEWMVPETQEDIQSDFLAAGSGAHAALAAMHMGADAIKAVEIACAISDGCALPVMYEEILARRRGVRKSKPGTL